MEIRIRIKIRIYGKVKQKERIWRDENDKEKLDWLGRKSGREGE